MRALIMAGGGMKVGFQAGVLQVWLDEAGIEFGHADGASGGCFNLAMYCEGRSGTQIADAWRDIEHAGLDPVTFAWAGPQEPGHGHYYAVVGSTFLIEYDNTQDGANHVHSVWRDFTNDFGGDVLAEHYAESAHHHDHE